MNDNFERIDNVFGVLQIDEHTGDEVARLIQKYIEENGLKMDNLTSVVRDDASNMQKACRLLDVDRSICLKSIFCIRKLRIIRIKLSMLCPLISFIR